MSIQKFATIEIFFSHQKPLRTVKVPGAHTQSTSEPHVQLFTRLLEGLQKVTAVTFSSSHQTSLPRKGISLKEKWGYHNNHLLQS